MNDRRSEDEQETRCPRSCQAPADSRSCCVTRPARRSPTIDMTRRYPDDHRQHPRQHRRHRWRCTGLGGCGARRRRLARPRARQFRL